MSAPIPPQKGGTGACGRVPGTTHANLRMGPLSGHEPLKPGGLREPPRTVVVSDGSLPLGGMVGMDALIPRLCAGASVWAYGQRP